MSSTTVKQTRVIQNILLIGFVFILIVFFVRDRLYPNLSTVFWATLSGIVYSEFHWTRLKRRISRKDRRFERNKVFVRYISPFEIVLLAAASSHYILFGLVVLVFFGLLFDWIFGFWLSVLIGCFGLSASVFLGVRILVYELRHGPLYYQYDSRAWNGAEGMLYQCGKVVQRLAPNGKVMVNGELWNAVSLSGESIDVGAMVEVISSQGLTLNVDRVPNSKKSDPY